jgi:hypothetical protein
MRGIVLGQIEQHGVVMEGFITAFICGSGTVWIWAVSLVGRETCLWALGPQPPEGSVTCGQGNLSMDSGPPAS